MEPLLLVQGRLTESDLLSVARYTARNRSVAMRIMLGLACLMVLIGVASIAMGQAGNSVVPLVLGGFYMTFLFVSPSLSVKKQMKESAHVSQEGRYEFDGEHFSINRPSLNVSMLWSDVQSVVELPDAFAIFTTKLCFFAVPKRFFDSNQLSTFRTLIQSTPGKSGKPLCQSPGNRG